MKSVELAKMPSFLPCFIGGGGLIPALTVTQAVIRLTSAGSPFLFLSFSLIITLETEVTSAGALL